MDEHQNPEEATKGGQDHLRAAAGDLKEAADAKVETIHQAVEQKAYELRGAAQGKAQELRGAAESAWSDAGSQAKNWQVEGEAYVRDNPTKAVLMALGVGYLLQIIPFRRLLVLALKLCLKLARPVLFLLCAFQVSKYIIKGASKNKVDVTVTSEQIQHRAYLIAERRERFGVSGDETGDWAQAERELRAEATKSDE
jgi:ElaB/YqjD/DUF883 family membrane-anchored ribosome-binding protein